MSKITREELDQTLLEELDTLESDKMDKNSLNESLKNTFPNLVIKDNEFSMKKNNNRIISLRDGRIYMYDFSTGKVTGYLGQTYNEIGGSRYPGNVFGNAYNSYYTTFGLDANFANDSQTTGQGFDPFITIAYYAHNGMSRGVYFNKPLFLNDNSPIHAGAINISNDIVPKYANTSNCATLANPWRTVYTNIIKAGGSTLLLAGKDSGSKFGDIAIIDDGYVYPSWGNGKFDLGKNDARFGTLRCVSPVNVSSDRNLKENIKPIGSENLLKSTHTNDIITYEDMYNFIKDDLQLNTYNYKELKEKTTEIGFIAQDIVNTKIGKEIIVEGETLSYSQGSYENVLAGALKKAINKIEEHEELFKNIEQRLSILEEENRILKEKLDR